MALWETMSLTSRAAVLTANLLNAKHSTQFSTMTQRTRQGCRFILLTFPAEPFKFSKAKNSFLPSLGIANSTSDLKTELCLPKIWHHQREKQDLKAEMMAGKFSLYSRSWFGTSSCRHNQQTYRAHGTPDWEWANFTKFILILSVLSHDNCK